jgi:hypothetical protein
MKNEHLVPVNIVDIVNKLTDPTVRENERMNYVMRLEAIRDYVTQAVYKHNASKPVVKQNTRRIP